MLTFGGRGSTIKGKCIVLSQIDELLNSKEILKVNYLKDLNIESVIISNQ